jgi:hypothetical protein
MTMILYSPCHKSRLSGVVIDTLLLSCTAARSVRRALKVKPMMARAFASYDQGAPLEECTTRLDANGCFRSTLCGEVFAYS